MWLFFYGFFQPQTFAQVEALRVNVDSSAVSDVWFFTGVAVMTLSSSSAAVMVGFLSDMRSGRLSLHLSSGARPWHMIWGHILAATLMGFFASVFVIVVGQVWALAFGQPIISVQGWLVVLVGLALGALFFSALNAAAVTVAHSPGLFGAYCFLGGTATGVLSFAFTLNYRLGMTQVVGFLPFAQVSALIREPLLQPGLATLGDASHELQDLLGAHIHLGHGGPWTYFMMVIVLVGWIALLGTWCHYRVNRLVNKR
jgi:hypothetical protein